MDRAAWQSTEVENATSVWGWMGLGGSLESELMKMDSFHGGDELELLPLWTGSSAWSKSCPCRSPWH